MAIKTTINTEINHKNFNLEELDNLHTLPKGKAVFGIFALLNNKPINCRIVGETENLYETIIELFENPPENGLNYFMQGAWIKMLQYQEMPGSTLKQRQVLQEYWQELYDPQIEDSGEYPGYYEH